jgi:hypothetical protein
VPPSGPRSRWRVGLATVHQGKFPLLRQRHGGAPDLGRGEHALEPDSRVFTATTATGLRAATQLAVDGAIDHGEAARSKRDFY